MQRSGISSRWIEKGERKSHKALNTVCERIFGHIRKEYERNIALKQELVQQAQALALLEDLREAIEQSQRHPARMERSWDNAQASRPAAVEGFQGCL